MVFSHTKKRSPRSESKYWHQQVCERLKCTPGELKLEETQNKRQFSSVFADIFMKGEGPDTLNRTQKFLGSRQFFTKPRKVAKPKKRKEQYKRTVRKSIFDLPLAEWLNLV